LINVGTTVAVIVIISFIVRRTNITGSPTFTAPLIFPTGIKHTCGSVFYITNGTAVTFVLSQILPLVVKLYMPGIYLASKLGSDIGSYVYFGCVSLFLVVCVSPSFPFFILGARICLQQTAISHL
jgi:hypothetical protein